MKVTESIKKAAGKIKGSFNAKDVQAKVGDGKTMVHISYVRAALGQMVKDGQLQVTGKGKGRKYQAPSAVDAAPAPQVEETEVERVRRVLAECGGNKTKAGQALGMDRRRVARLAA